MYIVQNREFDTTRFFTYHKEVLRMTEQRKPPLYDPSFEHDNCGIGAIVNIDGTKDYATVDNALAIVERLEHRAGKDAAGETGDGVGIMRRYVLSAPGRAAPEPGKENAGDHLRKKGRLPAGLA